MSRVAAGVAAVGLGAVAALVACTAAESASRASEGDSSAAVEIEIGSGFVFEDLDEDGLRDPGEPGVAGAVVAQGATLVRSDHDGRYVLRSRRRDDAVDGRRTTRFVVLTRPEGFDAPRWYRAEPGDFALVRRAGPPADETDGGDAVFAHVTDAHFADRVDDYARHAVPRAIARMPRWLGGVAAGLMFGFQDPDYDADRATEALRVALARRGVDASGWSGPSVRGEWVRTLSSLDGSEAPAPIDPIGDFEAALEELRAIGPSFVVATGDFVLDGNDADAATVDRWIRAYRERIGATGLGFHHTIGNNEIAGSGEPDFRPGDPGYGKALFRAHFGPTHYSFDRAGLHFVALDTHARNGDAEDEDWSFRSIDPEVAAWLEADLAMHAGRPTVVLNHEPIGGDPRWSATLRRVALVDREVREQLEAAGVGWTLTGHLHVNGLRESGGTQHIATGALSGMRWSFPEEVLARGYRLLQVRRGALYSVWKPTGEAVLDVVAPHSASRSFGTSPLDVDGDAARAGGSRPAIVIAAVDAAGPLSAVEARLDGTPVALDWWSPYFAALAPGDHADGEHTVVLEATRAGGERVRTEAVVGVGVPHRR